MIKYLVFLSASTCLFAGAARADAFNEALEQAYLNSPVIRAERQALAATDENVSQANAGFFPTIAANYDRGRERIRYQGQNDWAYGDTSHKGLTLNQPLFNGLQTLADFKSAKAETMAGRARLQQVEQNVLLSAAFAYLDLMEKQALLELSRQNQDALSKEVDTAVTRLNAGEITATDVSQADNRLAYAEAQTAQAEGELAAARAAYRRSVGADPVNIDGLPNVPPLPASAEEARLAADANPALQSARWQEKAAEHRVDSRTGALLPVASLQGAIRDTDGASRAFGVDNYRDDSLVLNLSIPLYQSGAEYSRVRQAKNLREQAKYQEIDVRQAAQEEAEQAWQRHRAADTVIAAHRRAIKAAEAALLGVREEHRVGARTTLDVLDAEQELYTARINLLRSQVAERLDAYRLIAAMGRMNPEALRLNVNAYDPRAHYEAVRMKRAGFNADSF